MKPIKSLRQILSQEMMDGSKRYGPSGDQRTAGEVPTRFAAQASPFPSAAACAAAGRRPSPLGRYPLSVAQIFNLPYRRFVIGGTLLAGGMWQVKNLRYSPARRSRNQRSAGLVRGQCHLFKQLALLRRILRARGEEHC